MPDTPEPTRKHAKTVTIALVMDTRFISGLIANLNLSGPGKNGPIHALAWGVCAEARGDLPENVRAKIGDEWSPHLHVVSEARVVVEHNDLSPEAQEATECAALLGELTWRGILEASSVEERGQTALADKLVELGKLTRRKRKHPTSGDFIPVYEIPGRTEGM